MTTSPQNTMHDPYIDEPLQISSADELNWSDSADLVVVGYGGAGVSAALEGVERGASVIAIDRFEGGGATAQSGGVVYLGGGTRIQKQNGYNDTPEEMFKYLQMETEGVVSDETLRAFCESSAETFDWLEANGVEFNASESPVKTSYPTDDYYFYYSGSEAALPYAEQAKPAPRGHRAYGKGLSGAAFYTPLQQSAERKGVKTLYHTRVNRLVMDNEERVVGVEVKRIPTESKAAERQRSLNAWVKRLRQYLLGPADNCRQKLREVELNPANSVTEYIRADKGVVISAGGFIMNPQMVNQYAPKYNEALALGDTGCDGVGIRLGASIGGALERMSRVSAWRFINPPFAWAKGIVVNAKGERYCNEQVYGAKLGYHMVEEQDGRAILILNKALMKEAVSQSMPWKLWLFQAIPALMNMWFNAKKGATVEALAQRCGMSEQALRESIDRYNQAARGEAEDLLRKSPEFIQSLEQGPYYAMDISVDSQLYPCSAITLGGLKVDGESGLIEREDGSVIDGLYAAGRSAVGVASNHYQSGLSIADCVFSGRRAARHALRAE